MARIPFHKANKSSSHWSGLVLATASLLDGVDLSVEQKMNLTFEEHYAITQLYIFVSAAKNTYFDQIFFKSNYLEFYSLILMEHYGQRIACSV